MASIAVIGDGPAGLSAALFLARNGHAGAGAIAALDILAREAGSDVHDWDSL